MRIRIILIVAVLVISSVIAPLGALGPVGVVSALSAYQESFEDGAPGGFTQTSDSLYGEFAGIPSGTPSAGAPSGQYDNITFSIKSSDWGENEFQNVWAYHSGAGANSFQIDVNPNTICVFQQYSGDTCWTVSEVDPGEWITIRVENMDWGSHTHDLRVYDANGTQVLHKTNLEFANDAPNEIRSIKLSDKDSATFDHITFNKPYQTPIEYQQSLKSEVSGEVTTQNGQPVENATVQLTISKKPSVPQADTQLDSISDPIPQAYTDQIANGFKLLGSNGALDDTNAPYALLYDESDLGTRWDDTADLSSPHITDVPVGENITIIAADPSKSCGVAGFLEDEYDRQLPGCTLDEATIHVDKLTGSNQTTDSIPLDLDHNNDGQLLEPAKIDYAEMSFSEGIYRITVETDDGMSSFSYLVKAGNPMPDFNKYQRDVNDALTSQATEMRDAISSNTLEVKRVTTNETGHWNASVPNNAKVVAVSAMKAPGVDVDPQNLTQNNVTAAYSAEDIEDIPNASVYLPSTTKRVTPPAENVDLTLQEVSFPSTAKLKALQGGLTELRERLQNLTMDDLPPALMQQLEDAKRAPLETLWNTKRETLKRFEPAREAYYDLSGRDSLPEASELSRSELETAINNAEVATTRQHVTNEVTETTVEKTKDAVTTSWAIADMDLSEANVSVIADYSNGTSRVVPSEFVSVNSNTLTADQIVLEDYPLGETDPAQVSFRLEVAGNDKLAKDTKTVTNPTFSGEAPKIDAVEFTTLEPGPSDSVTVQVHPDESSSVREVTNFTVFGPDGTELDTANITGGDQTTFTTAGEGVHTVRYTVETTDGSEFTDTVRIRAHSEDQNHRPSAYVREGPLGTYAVVGDGFVDGDVETTSDGALDITVGVAGDQDIPNKVDVFLEGTSTTQPVTINVVKGEAEESVRKHVIVLLHGKKLNTPDDGTEGEALVWANGNPVTWDGSTRFGQISQDADGSTIEAFTSSSGTLTVETANQPGSLDRLRFWLATRGISSPLFIIPSGSFGALLFVVGRRRARSH